MWIQQSGTSFFSVGNVYLLQALKVLRADVKLPTRHKMSGAITDKLVKEINSKRDT